MVNYFWISHPRPNNAPEQLKVMSYFTWKETGLTSDCQSLEAMASRFEESANLMRRMAKEGFKLEKQSKKQLITHPNPKIFEEWGFITEESPIKQLTLIADEDLIVEKKMNKNQIF